jgi:hypothetical protein
VATPTSAIPAALASADTSKKRECCCYDSILRFNALEVYKQTIKNNIFSFQKLKSLNKYSILLKYYKFFKLF